MSVVSWGRPGATAQLSHRTAVFPASAVATTWPWVTVGVPTAAAPYLSWQPRSLHLRSPALAPLPLQA